VSTDRAISELPRLSLWFSKWGPLRWPALLIVIFSVHIQLSWFIHTFHQLFLFHWPIDSDLITLSLAFKILRLKRSSQVDYWIISVEWKWYLYSVHGLTTNYFDLCHWINSVLPLFNPNWEDKSFPEIFVIKILFLRSHTQDFLFWCPWNQPGTWDLGIHPITI
jgi:hypothetical protein